MKKKVWIGVVIVIGLGAMVVFNLRTREKFPQVQSDQVLRGELVEIVNASGRLEPKTSVDVSATVMGKITRLSVREGDWVEEGQFLLEIDPEEYVRLVEAYQAGLNRTREELTLALANEEQAQLDLERAENLHGRGLYTKEQLDSARTHLRVRAAQVAAARAAIAEAEANLNRVRHDLTEVTILSPIAGIVTRLNVDEGENAIIGTMNNPGTLLLTVADLDTMETEVEVDETEVVRVRVSQEATIEVDAYPDTTFHAVVTEVGNSPIFSSTGIGQQAVDFEVVLRLVDSVPDVRPGLSASADIQVAYRESALSIPIASMVVREWSATEDEEPEEEEGVFVIDDDGVVQFRPVKVGIAGDERFEVIRGLEEDETVVSGPFRELRDLEDGDKVEIAEEP